MLDLNRVKTVLFRYVGQDTWFLGSRYKPGNNFHMGVILPYSYITEKSIADPGICRDVQIIEEFTDNVLLELVGDAPAFTVQDKSGINWLFARFESTNTFTPSRISHWPNDDQTFNEELGYELYQIVDELVLATVVQLRPVKK